MCIDHFSCEAEFHHTPILKYILILLSTSTDVWHPHLAVYLGIRHTGLASNTIISIYMCKMRKNIVGNEPIDVNLVSTILNINNKGYYIGTWNAHKEGFVEKNYIYIYIYPCELLPLSLAYHSNPNPYSIIPLLPSKGWSQALPRLANWKPDEVIIHESRVSENFNVILDLDVYPSR